MIYIKDGMVADPAGDRLYEADLVIGDGKVQKIIPRQKGMPLQEEQADRKRDGDGKEVTVIDARGLVIAPGLADTHVHFRDPGFTYKEDIETGAAAAAKGGFTEIVLMANTRPCVDNEDTLLYVLEKGKGTGIHIRSCANVTRGMAGKELVDMEGLAKAGAAGFTDDGIPLLNKELVKEAMERAVKLHKPVSFHEENPGMIANNGVNAGKASDFYGIGGSPREAEIDLVKRDLELALETGAEVVIQHISTKEAVELLRKARAAGAHVHGEATPHHFTLTEEAVIKKGTLAKMNPPLRTEEDRLAVIEGLKDGTIDLIATDHAPHSRQEKERAITEAPSGIIGLETALSLGIRELVNKGYLTLPRLIYRMSTAPCALYNLSGGKISEGAPADLVLFAPEEMWTVTEEFASKSANSPFIGEELPGVVYYTICDGRVVYKKDEKSIPAFLLERFKIEWGKFDRTGIYAYTQRLLAYNSNKIEGSTLTEEQTASLFDNGTLPRSENYYRAKDVEETNGHFLMFNKMLDTLDEPLTQELIKQFHLELKSGVFEDRANGYAIGDYKMRPNMIGMYQTVRPENVESEMRLLIEWYCMQKADVAVLAEFHARYESIHPFQDGNGRTGRLILFRECLRNGIVPVVIEDVNRNEYLDALKEFREEKRLDKMTELFRKEQKFYLNKCRYFM